MCIATVLYTSTSSAIIILYCTIVESSTLERHHVPLGEWRQHWRGQSGILYVGVWTKFCFLISSQLTPRPHASASRKRLSARNRTLSLKYTFVQGSRIWRVSQAYSVFNTRSRPYSMLLMPYDLVDEHGSKFLCSSICIKFRNGQPTADCIVQTVVFHRMLYVACPSATLNADVSMSQRSKGMTTPTSRDPD